MADRTNTHNSTGNGGSMGSIDGGEMGEFLVVGSSMGEIWKEWGKVLWCGGR